MANVRNMEISIDKDNIMTIRVNLNENHGLSGSCKSTIIASSGGFHNVNDALGRKVYISANIGTK